MNDPQPTSPRARLQELQAIPERQRTDAEWDELNELEIMLASSNREGAPQPGGRGNNPQQSHGHSRPGGGQQHHGGKKPDRNFHRRQPKRGGPR
jgi:hypothetical protein